MTIDLKAAAKGAAIGGLAAGFIGVGIYFVASAMGATFKPRDPAAMGGLELLPPFQPLVICIIATVVALGLLTGLVKFAGDKAWPIFLGFAALAFLGEAYAPFWAFTDMKTIVALEIMHLPATIGILGGIHMARRG